MTSQAKHNLQCILRLAWLVDVLDFVRFWGPQLSIRFVIYFCFEFWAWTCVLTWIEGNRKHRLTLWIVSSSLPIDIVTQSCLRLVLSLVAEVRIRSETWHSSFLSRLPTSPSTSWWEHCEIRFGRRIPVTRRVPCQMELNWNTLKNTLYDRHWVIKNNLVVNTQHKSVVFHLVFLFG